MKSRIEWLDMLKGVAIILVVIRHVLQANIMDCSVSLVGNMIYAVQMPLFMLVAGYFSVTNIHYYDSLDEVSHYIKKRAIHYMTPFISWFFIVNILIRGAYDRNILEGLSILINNVDIGLWFLYVVFVLSLVLIISKWISKRLFKSKNLIDLLSFFIAIALIILLLILGLWKGTRFLGINLIVYYFIYFALGNLIFSYRDFLVYFYQNRIVQTIAFFVSIIVFFSVCINVNIELSNDTVYNILLRIVAALFGVMAISIATFWISRIKYIKNITSILGRYTLEIYVAHVHFIGLLPKGSYYLMTWQGQKIFGISFGITVFLTWITVFIIKRINILDLLLFGNKRTR